jgi:hypothetical protein
MKVIGEGDAASLRLALADRLEFFLALHNQLVLVDWGGAGGLVIRHEKQCS